jgi:hypothetical protein
MEMVVLEAEDLERGCLFLSNENEVFEVVENLSENISYCSFIKTFLMKSLENPEKEIFMFGYLTQENQITIESFKKLPTLN